MGKLDFSALNQLAYRGFESEEAQAEKDRLIEQGFTVVEDDKGNPFTSPQTASERRSAPPASAVSQGTSDTPRSATGTLRDKQIFRTVFNHMAEADKILSSAGNDAERLDKAWEQVSETSADLLYQWNDAFITDMLTAIQEELHRRYFEEPLSSSASAADKG
jgi:hypothetical protein